MHFGWIASVPVVIGGVCYAVGCSDSEQDVEKDECASDHNPCTIDDCTQTVAQPTLVPNGTIVEVGPDNAAPAQCQQWVCQDGLAQREALAFGAACTMSDGNKGHCSALQRCVQCEQATDCPLERSICDNSKCVACVSGGIPCGSHLTCGKCTGETCSVANVGECASGHCVAGICG